MSKNGDLTKEAMNNAFSDEQIERFNQGREKAVKKVKLLYHFENLDHLNTKKDPNEKKFVDGENHCVLVTQNGKGERNVEPRTRFEALQHYQDGVPLDSDKGEVLFSLQAHEAVYVPEPGEEVDLEGLRSEKERKYFAYRVYNFRKNSKKEMYFLPHHVADFIESKKEYGTQDRLQFIDTDEPRTKIIDNAIKLQIDRLGHVQDVLVKKPLVQH
jgi:hypothetical protein